MLKTDFFAICRNGIAVLALGLAGLAASAPVSLAEQVGTAVVNGRIVILDSDGTWQFQDEMGQGTAARSSCETLEHMRLCLDTTGWSKANLPGDFIGSYRSSNKYFLGIVYEPSGSNDGYTYEFLQQAIIQNAATASNTAPENVPILDSKANAQEMDGFRSVTYSPTINGAPFVFHNIFRIYPDRAVQFAFWTIGKEYTADFRDKVEKFARGVSFTQ